MSMPSEDKTYAGFPEVELITINYNGLAFLADYFKNISQLEYPQDKLHLYFVDNNSRDGSLDFVKHLSDLPFKLTVIANKKNYGFAQANNMAFARCSAPYIGLLNNDTKVDKMWLQKLVEKIQSDPSIGMVSSREMPREASRFIDPHTNQTSWCSGGHCLIRLSALKEIGYFDEQFFMYAEDVDLSWRMWLAGFKCVYVPQAICEHHFGKPGRYGVRRNYYYVRNSILLRYAYGSFADVKKAYNRWLKEGIYRLLKKPSLRDALSIFTALVGHIPYITYFLHKKKALLNRYNLKALKNQWISL